ncbi:MAG: spore photoproduct lyase [Clostridia bacterium]|nr:spore photoproduct lyase [Clostridia bacterium]
MHYFTPARVYFEPQALAYPLGQKLFSYFRAEKIPIAMTTSHNRVTGIPGATAREAFVEAKKTLVVGVKRTLTLNPCRPSADYEFALGTSCPGGCRYCYLATTLGRKPYIRIYVNLEEILHAIEKYIAKNLPAITTFEAASTSDPVAVEHLTGSLRKTIEFFGRQEHGRLRVVTKYAGIASLLTAEHNNHTKFRFSLNTQAVIGRFEPGTARFAQRLEAAGKMAAAGYPLGFIIAPIFIYENWRADYRHLLAELAKRLDPVPPDLSFELISHRFTARAKKIINERFPNSGLEMEEEKRQFKWGKRGYGKYLYPPEHLAELEEFFRREIPRFFPKAVIEYFI